MRSPRRRGGCCYVAGKRVLIVHDDPGFFENTKAALSSAIPDSETVGAISAPRALGMAKQHRPDVIIADGDLEGMDGYAFTAEIKGDADLASIPVLIVANDPTEATALKARQVGAAGHLPSAIDSGTLVQKVAALVGVSVAAPAPVPAAAPSRAAAAPSMGATAPQATAPAPTSSYGAPQPV